MAGIVQVSASGRLKVVIVEEKEAPGKLLDLNMLLVLPGKERTRAEWEFLCREAGLEIASIRPIPDAVEPTSSKVSNAGVKARPPVPLSPYKDNDASGQ
jgi:hypothetical protein